uniref:NADH-ubiquinone oxidoreductase chain 4 n=1 Tax=Hapalochlaena fasciata TaxID=264556 RepID=A0A7L8XHF7_9MOLL|nr:NADH dehydrogenase subunit 4 [Hapalochlaena fasciata]QOH92326.1 NADH dehydrogenase subunit 4 [Hapalochlaena fasciata]
MLMSMILLIFLGEIMKWEYCLWFMMIFSFMMLKYLNIDFSGISEFMFIFDKLSSVLILLSFWTTSLMLLSSYKSIKMMSNKVNYFVSCVMLLCFVVVFFFLVENLMMFYLFFEISLIPTLMLILGWGYQPERLQAGMYMMLYTVSASLPLLLCLLLLGYKEGTYSMSIMNFLFINNMSIYWVIGLLLALLVKLPLYFFHLWLPKAHVEAPISGSMILASVLLKLGGYGIIRFVGLFNILGNNFMIMLIIICLWGGMLTSIICVGQSDMKSLIAYSSIGHMGVMLAGVISGFIVGWEGAVLMMFCHGLCSSGLFCLGNLIYEKINSRSLFLCGGMINYNPMMGLFMFLLCICNMGAPPFISLISEVMLYISMYMYSTFLLLFVLVMVFLGGLYNLIFYVSISHGQMMSFIKAISINKSNENLLLLMHIFPLLLFILNLGYVNKIYF